jgi:hypothetical protein
LTHFELAVAAASGGVGGKTANSRTVSRSRLLSTKEKKLPTCLEKKKV